MKRYVIVCFITVFVYWILLYLGETTIIEFSQKDFHSTKIDWIIVLGNGSKLAPHLVDRLNNTVMAHQLWPQARILLTGNENVKEVSVMKEYLISNDTPVNALVEEGQSTSTWQSFKHMKNIIGPDEFALIITNEFHQPRSLATANLMGYKSALFGKDSPGLPKNFYYTIREQFSTVKWYLQYLLYKL